MVKVLQIGLTPYIGGIENYLIQQFRHIDRKKVIYDFVNITAEKPVIFEEEIKKSGSAVFNINSRKNNPIKHYYQWIKFMYKEARNYDAVVYNAAHLKYIFPLVVAKLFGIKTRIIHSHSTGVETKLNIIWKVVIFINRCLMRFCATDYWACSTNAAKWMFGKKREYSIIHNAEEIIDFSYSEEKRKFIRKELKANDNFILGHIGRFAYSKNHDFLIELMNNLVSNNMDIILWLIGDYDDKNKYYKHIKEKVKYLGIEEKVSFLGFRNDVNILMQGMDCLLLPSRFEGLGMVVIEGQVAGLKCVVSDRVSREVELTDDITFLPLTEMGQWIEKILTLKKRDYIRKSNYNELRVAGYDINSEIKKVEKMFAYLKQMRV